VENFGRISLSWASMGIEAHRWIPRGACQLINTKLGRTKKLLG